MFIEYLVYIHSSVKEVAMFYVPSTSLSGTPSNGSSDVDGAVFSANASRNLSGLLDEQRKRGIGAALLTITGVLVC